MALSKDFMAAVPDSGVAVPNSTFTSSSMAASKFSRPSMASSALWMMVNCAGVFITFL